MENIVSVHLTLEYWSLFCCWSLLCLNYTIELKGQIKKRPRGIEIDPGTDYFFYQTEGIVIGKDKIKLKALLK